MTITVHRGTDQIGGTVTEIASNSTKILIDFGSQLEGAEKKDLNIDWDSGYDAVLLTHYHGDHIGEIDQIPENVPVYFGETATNMSLVLSQQLEGLFQYKKIWGKLKRQQVKTKILKNCKKYKNGESILLGDLKITPYHADHSAYDAYMLLIECDGKRILHTGDFRLNGYTGTETLENFKKIGEIDYLITEGTTLSREGYVPQSEVSIAEEAKIYLAEHKYVFVLCSSMNIDYIASIMNALPENKPLLVNPFQEKLLDLVRKEHKLPIYEFPEDKTKTISYKDTAAEDGCKETGFCMLVTKSANSAYFPKKLQAYADSEDSFLLYGMWDGYLKGKKNKDGKLTEDQEVVTIQEQFAGKFQQLHTSGHVGSEDLQKVIKILHPKKVFPIHTENQKGVEKLRGDAEVICLENGETYHLK